MSHIAWSAVSYLHHRSGNFWTYLDGFLPLSFDIATGYSRAHVRHDGGSGATIDEDAVVRSVAYTA